MCKKHQIDVSMMDMEGYYRVPLKNTQAAINSIQDKRVIMKFVNRKLLECLIKIKGYQCQKLQRSQYIW